MPLILPVKEKYPELGADLFIAPNATIVGDVVIGDRCSIWFNAVIRGDVNSITIGRETNIQDGAVIHATYQKAATVIGNRVSIGHNAIVHGCTVEDHVLIGMGAIVMDHACIEPFVIIAAGSVVLENSRCESGYLYAGTPARKIKPITNEQRALLERLPDNYLMYAGWFS
ncbi:gamma carbonic anhydrase family protein [Pedobacter yulinensis]|uniref:Gamma carbonic anhydrase family protein n=1 Tax=Pedobacter yulinensis TaxID=2126353 RepID=A0A2T3HRJ0_9SPHI|nr:gamma carbonic anhydrase family protein [Pedobacter yulinensis]PST85062.1 gamma carbonic anhydrase family protein [Pedobacter yulinensis]